MVTVRPLHHGFGQGVDHEWDRRNDSREESVQVRSPSTKTRVVSWYTTVGLRTLETSKRVCVTERATRTNYYVVSGPVPPDTDYTSCSVDSFSTPSEVYPSRPTPGAWSSRPKRRQRHQVTVWTGSVRAGS